MPKDFEFALLVPNISQKMSAVGDFLKRLKVDFPDNSLRTPALYCWSSSDTLGIVLTFDFSSFLPSYVKTITSWADKIKGQMFDLMSYGEKERGEFKGKFMMTSDIKFTGEYDIAMALKSISTRIDLTLGRKHARFDATIKVSFKTAKQFVHEYSENISKGGLFVATDQPLPVRSKLELVLYFPNYPKQVKVIGEVVHTVTPQQAKLLDGGKWPGMGVQFVEFEEDGESALLEYLKTLQ